MSKIRPLTTINSQHISPVRVANRQLADLDKELLQLHERNGDLDLEVQNLKLLMYKALSVMRIKGLEPSLLSEPEPKSGASANFAISARSH